MALLVGLVCVDYSYFQRDDYPFGNCVLANVDGTQPVHID